MWSSCLRIDGSVPVQVLSMDGRHTGRRKRGDQLGGYCSPVGKEMVGSWRRKDVSGILDIFLRFSNQDLLKGGMCVMRERCQG